MPAYQFNVSVDGVSVVTQGVVLEWMLPPTFFITPLGLLTRGLIIGLGDQWRYDETAVDPSWAASGTAIDPGWVVDDI